MEKTKKKGRAKTDEIARFPRRHNDAPELQSAFMTREELMGFLREHGFAFSPRLVGQLKIPQYLIRGKYERYEFFDTLSAPQPFPYHESDSPSICADRKESAPKWLGRWYMAVVGEEDQRHLVLFYRPKKVFLKCRLEDAERVVPSVMFGRTIAPGR